MFEIALGNPEGSLVYFLLFSGIGVALGGIVYAICAYPSARREEFRTFGAIHRTGIVLGLLIALGFIGFFWQSVFRDFYRIEIEGNEVRLFYNMPPRTVTLPLESVEGMRKHIVLGKGGKRRIQLQTDRGNYYSGNLNRPYMETAWEALSEYFRPLI